MALITLTQAKLAFGHVALLDNTEFSLADNERVGLIGRNGTGKSSLLKILGGIERLDDGLLQQQNNVRCAYVAQEPVFEDGIDVFTAVSQGVAHIKQLRERYEALSHDPHHSADELDDLQNQIESAQGWTWEQRVDRTLASLKLQADAPIQGLSGGTKKRVALAQALVMAPDVLLLDEPTNHLDIHAIEWLEELLNSFAGSVVLITHDRTFLNNVATRIVELDRGALRSYPGNFAQYERFKADQLATEAVLNEKFDKLLAQEEVWIRKGVEARRTRSVSRIARLQDLRDQRAARREQVGKVKLDVNAGERSGKLIAELLNVGKSFGERTVIQDFSCTILRGDKIGLIGPNGAGKTTLLRLILGELAPDSGTVRQGTNLQVAYFDQMRATLNLDATLADFISPGSEWVEINQQRKHVMSYLGDFLFSPARANSPIRSLSGGERNRLLLARLFARPANVLVLDEPTNDLDIETLELLEELLQGYSGTVFLVSHDRYFLDNVVTSTIACDDAQQGLWSEYEGGYLDWQQQSARRFAQPAQAPLTTAPTPAAASTATKPAASSKAKLSYKEQRELEQLPGKIDALETEQAQINSTLSDPQIYAKDAARATQLHQRAEQIEHELMVALERWEELGTRA